MNLTGQQHLPVSQARAWAALNDVAMLQAALPGCEAFTPAGDNAFEVLMVVSVGPVKARFTGKLRLSELTPPHSYRLSFEGSGGVAGHGKGQALMQLQAVAPQDTVLSYDVTASVGGRLAQIGSRLVDAATQQLAEEFFLRLQAALLHQHPSRQPAPAGMQKLRDWLRRFFH